MPRIEHPIHVFFDDTDMGGVVYHGRYVVWMEHARHALISSSGASPAQIMKEHGVALVASRMAVKFVRPACFEDRLVATARIADFDHYRLHFDQTIERGGKLLVRADVTATCIDISTGRPAVMPAAIIKRLTNAAPQNSAAQRIGKRAMSKRVINIARPREYSAGNGPVKTVRDRHGVLVADGKNLSKG